MTNRSARGAEFVNFFHLLSISYLDRCEVPDKPRVYNHVLAFLNFCVLQFCKRIGWAHWGFHSHYRPAGRRCEMMAKKAPNPIDKHVGTRVRLRRMMLGMSQEKLGDALGLTFQQVQKYEKGANRIGASRLQQISQSLQVPVAFFFEGVPNIPGQQPEAGADAPSPAYVSDFLATSDGLA